MVREIMYSKDAVFPHKKYGIYLIHFSEL